MGQKYPFLDAFRAYAVYWVVGHHIIFQINLKKTFGEIYGFFLTFFSIDLMKAIQCIDLSLFRVFACGNIGVDMFFVISGFLITGLLLDDVDGPHPIKRFYKRRFFKIAPPYLFAVFIALILYHILPTIFSDNKPHQPLPVTNPLGYIFFLQNYFVTLPSLSHTWSLVVEEQFYLFYPLIMFGIYHSCKEDPAQARRLLIIVCIFIIILLNLTRYLYFYAGIPIFNTPIKAPLVFQTITFRMDALVMGCLIKLLERHIKNTATLWQYITPIVFVLTFVIYYFFVIGKFTVGKFQGDTWFTYTLAYVAPTFLLVAGLRNFFLLKFLTEHPLLQYLGRNSYGIYLWHYILIFPIKTLVADYGYFASTVIYLTSATLMGIFSTMVIEKHFLNLRNKWAP